MRVAHLRKARPVKNGRRSGRIDTNSATRVELANTRATNVVRKLPQRGCERCSDSAKSAARPIVSSFANLAGAPLSETTTVLSSGMTTTNVLPAFGAGFAASGGAMPLL